MTFHPLLQPEIGNVIWQKERHIKTNMQLFTHNFFNDVLLGMCMVMLFDRKAHFCKAMG